MSVAVKLVKWSWRVARERRQRRVDAAQDARLAAVEAGERLALPAPPRRRARRLVRAARHRVVRPLWLVAALWLAGLTAPSWSWAGLVVAVLAAGWWVWRGRRLSGAGRWYGLAVVAASAGWLVSARVWGPWTVDQWWIVVAAVVAVPWLRATWPRPVPAVPDVAGPEDFGSLWAANVADTDGAAPRSVLTVEEVVPGATTWRLEMQRGRHGQTLDGMLAALPRIATGTDTPVERIMIEPHPTVVRPSVLQVKELHDSPGDEVRYLHTPMYDDGRVKLGPYADGVGAASWRVYSPEKWSMWGGFIAGGTGSGKSRELEMIALTMRWAWQKHGVPTAIIYVDGQGGASSPTLWEHATWAVGPDELGDVLDALDRADRARRAFNKVHGLAGFRPGYSPAAGAQGLTGLLVISDEHHVNCPNKAWADRWAQITRERRKGGQAVIAADQATDLSVFGGSDVLRATLLDGNGAVHRVSSQSAGDLIPGLALNPKKLPAIPGYGYKVAAPQSGERTAAYRTFYLPSSEDDRPEGVRTVEEWFAATEDAPIDDLTVAAFGDVFTERHARKAAALEADRALLEGRDIPAEREAVTAGPVLRAVGPSAPVKRAAWELILDLMRRQGGTATKREMVEHCGVSASAVTQACQKLRRDGLAEQVGDGVWRLPMSEGDSILAEMRQAAGL